MTGTPSLILTLILIVVCIIALSHLATVVTNAAAERAAKAVFERDGLHGLAFGCLIPILSFVLAGLWTWFAVEIHEWRFAAITWVPFITHWIGRLAMKRTVINR